VEDVRPLAPQHPEQLDQPDEITPEAKRPPDVPQRHEPRTCRLRRLANRALAVRCDRDLEIAHERGKQRGDVRLRAADLRERDREQDLRPTAIRGS
jgi:hypothetical protein